MKIKRCNDEAVILDGLCEDTGDAVKIEVVESHGDEILCLNGKSYRVDKGACVVSVADFLEKENDIRLFSGGKWYWLRGVVRDGMCLKYSEAYLQASLVQCRLLIARLYEQVGENEKNISEIEKRITGESFL